MCQSCARSRRPFRSSRLSRRIRPLSSAAACRTRAGLAPAPAASWAARAAGCQASSIVLSPGSARPRICTPTAASPKRAATSREDSTSPPQTRDARRKAVPSNGPAAPPTVASSVVATILNTPAGVADAPAPSEPSRESSLAVAARMPRSRLTPWSPSPTVVSSAVSSSRCSATACAAPRIQATLQATSSGLSSVTVILLILCGFMRCYILTCRTPGRAA